MNDQAHPNHPSAIALEWPRFLALATEHARTAPGRARLMNLAQPENWASDLAEAEVLQQQTRELQGLLVRDVFWGPLVGLEDPLPALDRLARGAVLDVAELGQIRSWLYAIDSWSQTPSSEQTGILFRQALSSLPDPRREVRALDQILTASGELSENASPQLEALYREIRSVRGEIGARMEELVTRFHDAGVLQEKFSDVHEGRYVLPVRVSAQSQVPGIIYGNSGTRQTVFIEPREIEQLNNRLKQRQNELEEEIFRILTEVCESLRPTAREISAAVEVLSSWDAVQARARIGLRYGGKSITVGDERRFVLNQTGHPLLWWAMPPEEIIRNDLCWEPPSRTLLLTGPNTGGKTVLLKTFGFAAICARTGFPFPGTGELRVPFVDRIFVDIGDPQSIEAHLSSFAGHLRCFREILDQFTPRSLVLMDELNTATDPDEGAALGRAFLETLMEGGTDSAAHPMIVATTHDPQLKALALSNSAIQNASMEFDERKHLPTYRIVLGVPGRSRALETAKRLGIPERVLERARGYLSEGHQRFENLLASLEADTQDARKLRNEAQRIRDEADRMRREWSVRAEKSARDLLERARQKVQQTIARAEEEIRQSVRRIQETRSQKEAVRAREALAETQSQLLERVNADLREEAPEVVAAVERVQKEKGAVRPLRLEVGATVRVPKWKSLGTVLEVSGEKVRVSINGMKVMLSPLDVEVLSPDAPAVRAAGFGVAPKVRIRAEGEGEREVDRLDLRGIRFEEAMVLLENYLDRAFRGGNEVITIIHGLGTGALREGTLEVLRRLPYVREFRDGGAGQGGSGATVVTFEVRGR